MNGLRKVYLLALLLAVLVPVAVMAGGSGEGAEAGEKMTITWMSNFESPWALEEASRLFNVNIVTNGIDINDRPRREIMIAAQEWPDCGPSAINVLDGYNQGVHKALPIAALRKYAPNYAALMDQYAIGWLVNKNPENDEEVLAINGISLTTQANLWYPQFRIDWIRNVGMDLTGYDDGKSPLDGVDRVFFYDYDITIDWLEDFLYAARDGDVNGNGKVGDVIPMGASNNIGRSWSPLLGAYGVVRGANRMYNGKFYSYQTDPGFKDFLLKMAEWYEADLIDKEFPTFNHTKHWDKIMTGQLAFSCEQLSYAGQTWAMNRPPNTWVPDEEVGTGAEAVMVWPPIGPNGDQGSRRYGELPVRYSWVIYGHVSDEKMAKILEVVNWRASDEGFAAYQAGKAGVHYDWEGEPYASRQIPRATEDIPAGFSKDGGVSPYPPFYTAQRTSIVQPPILAKWYQNYAFSEKGQKTGTRPYRFDLFGSQELRDVNEMYGETLDTMFNEMFFKGITGQVDVEAEWDSYVQKWFAAGGDKYMAALEKLPLMEPLDQGKVEY